MTNDTVDTNTTTTLAEQDVWTTGPDGEQIPNYEATFPTINEGEVVHGQVVRVDKDEVLVDIGYKSEGVIPVAELSIRRSVNPEDEVKLGDEIDALVLTKEDADGRLILSKKRARFEIAWKAIEGAAESGEAVTGRVIEVVKGGLILDLGVRGFLPASLVDIRRVQDLDEFLGQELRCKVIELNRSRNNVVLSRRAVLEDERKEMRQAILDRLSPGDVVEGQISNIVDFGAFVDLDGMDGLIHISELSWSHVNHPSEVLEIGQDVQVKVLDIDRDRQRISLDVEHLDLHVLPDLEHFGRVVDVAARELRDVDQAVHAVEVDERAEVDDVRDLTLDDVTRREPVEDRLAHLLALVLEDGATREHDVVPRPVELDHLAAELLAEKLVEVLDATDVDQRRGQEAADAEVEDQAALDDLDHPAGHRLAALGRSFDRLPRDLEARPLLGEDQPSVGVLLREHERVDLVAELDFVLGVHRAADRELRDRDHAFGLVADVDEDLVLVDADDLAVDDLALVDRREGRLVVRDLSPLGP